MKKIIVLFSLFSFVVFSWSIFYVELCHTKVCPFCSQEVLARQKFYEDELVLGLVDHRPLLPGHILIIPKRHVERFEMLTEEEVVHMTRLIKKVNSAVEEIYGTSSYFLLQKNGSEVGQSVPHVHFHYVPRKKGENTVLPLLFRLYMTPFRTPLKPEEVEKQALRLRLALSTRGESQ